MEQPLQWRLDLCCHIKKKEGAIFRKCCGRDIMRITQHKNIFSAQSTWVMQTVNGSQRQGSTSVCTIGISGHFRTSGLYETRFPLVGFDKYGKKVCNLKTFKSEHDSKNIQVILNHVTNYFSTNKTKILILESSNWKIMCTKILCVGPASDVFCNFSCSVLLCCSLLLLLILHCILWL